LTQGFAPKAISEITLNSPSSRPFCREPAAVVPSSQISFHGLLKDQQGSSESQDFQISSRNRLDHADTPVDSNATFNGSIHRQSDYAAGQDVIDFANLRQSAMCTFIASSRILKVKDLLPELVTIFLPGSRSQRMIRINSCSTQLSSPRHFERTAGEIPGIRRIATPFDEAARIELRSNRLPVAIIAAS